MKVLVNVFHPNLATSTINRHWVETLQTQAAVTLNLHYHEYPHWQIDIAREQALLREHDRIVFQHPFFWYSTPPLMKKWFDDVLTYGWAYGPNGTALHGKEWVSAISTGGPAGSYQAGGYNNYSMSELLKPLQQTAQLIGMKFLPAFIFQGAVQATPDDIAQSAQDYLNHISDPELDPQLRLRHLLAAMDESGTTLAA